ncbi:alpha/beta hydrolase [Noviherbaspirillum cavernae]|uniref:Alpha/beta hydrolase n=2 Tax=Noviherbaspirillum cavernae TaxID=2320862 RepID=A0A418WWX7_9BURK|nr:alpha/beta hydrolase [Noviherbaspirillum cavernae]
MSAMIALLTLLVACATPISAEPERDRFAAGNLLAPDVALRIPGLGPCTDNPDRTLHLNSQQPVTVFVHGWLGTSGGFRGLAQVFALHGQQTACFSYNDRDSLVISAGQLAAALGSLAANMSDKHVTVIGHSQGALIARKSLVADLPAPIRNTDIALRLVTVSGPFSGIHAAQQCTEPAVRVLTLGLVVPICILISGDKWFEIVPDSDFIRHPGPLIAQVRDYLKIDTDERGACRMALKGECVKHDYVFSLDEQSNVGIEQARNTRVVAIKAGHVEIIGDADTAPLKLVALLQQNGVLEATAPERKMALQALLRGLYGVPSETAVLTIPGVSSITQ